MNSILYLILGVICILMFFVNRQKKYIFLLINYICLTPVTIPGVPFGNSVYIVPICFFISELKNFTNDYHNLSPYIKKILLIMIIATIVLQINSPHYNDSAFNTTRLIISELITKYFIIAYAFISIKDFGEFKKISKGLYYALIILTVFGILNLITHNSILLNSLGFENSSDDSDRFRVQAMFENPFDYGYTCIILLYIIILLYNKGFITIKKYYISIVCCIFGIVTCGSRSVILTAIVSYLIYIILAKSFSKKLYILFIATILSIFSYNFIPSVNDKINQTLTIFTDSSGNEVGGSNLDMRETQYLTTLFYIKDNPLFGRGKDFFNIDLGWKDIDENRDLVITDLAGLEGVAMSLLLERGFIGLIFYLIFYITLFHKFIKYKKYDKETSCIGISIIIAYMFFANSNGELHSVGSTLLICGALLHILENQKRKYITIHNKILF